MSQAQLGRRWGYTQGMISLLEAGKRPMPRWMDDALAALEASKKKKSTK